MAAFFIFITYITHVTFNHMKILKRVLVSVTAVLLAAYVGVLGWFYLNQEQLIFRPDKLPTTYRFSFSHEWPFEEITVPTGDGEQLHGLLFKTESDSARGLLFYLHGNRGALDRWGNRADLFIENGFDTFMLDYRGFGKSSGAITSEEQFMDDVDRAYRQLAARYPDHPKIIVGYSIGTGPASYLARKYQPELLILMAPYFSLPDLSSQLYPYLPQMLAKYEFANYKYLPEYSSRAVIFHGDEDRLIDISASRRLSEYFSGSDTLIVLQGQGHGGMYRNRTYRQEVSNMLGTF